MGASVRAVLVKNRLTKEGTALPLWQYPLQLTTESSLGSGDNYIFLAWPMTVMHRIDKVLQQLQETCTLDLRLLCLHFLTTMPTALCNSPLVVTAILHKFNFFDRTFVIVSRLLSTYSLQIDLSHAAI